MALDAAAQAGWRSVILVGDEPYYGPLGFARIPHGRLTIPWPVDPDRLLIHEIAPGALDALTGDIVHAGLARPRAEPDSVNPVPTAAAAL